MGSGGAWECEPFKGEPSQALIIAVFAVHFAVIALLIAAAATPFWVLYSVLLRIGKWGGGYQDMGGGRDSAGIERKKMSKKD